MKPRIQMRIVTSLTPSARAARFALMPGCLAYSTAHRRSALEKRAPMFEPDAFRRAASSRNLSAVIFMRTSVHRAAHAVWTSPTE
ncbi:MAG: hypothetical protein JWN04_1926 [Myxococcaceae bacterium]|nr:hypothetical protein [Myxococcaceae bacterium]